MFTHPPEPEVIPPEQATPFDAARQLYDAIHAGLKARIDGLEPSDMWTQTVTITAALIRVERAVTSAAKEIAAAIKSR